MTWWCWYTIGLCDLPGSNLITPADPVLSTFWSSTVCTFSALCWAGVALLLSGTLSWLVMHLWMVVLYYGTEFDDPALYIMEATAPMTSGNWPACIMKLYWTSIVLVNGPFLYHGTDDPVLYVMEVAQVTSGNWPTSHKPMPMQPNLLRSLTCSIYLLYTSILICCIIGVRYALNLCASGYQVGKFALDVVKDSLF